MGKKTQKEHGDLIKKRKREIENNKKENLRIQQANIFNDLKLKLGKLYDHKRIDRKEHIRKDLFPKCCAEESVIEPSWP